MPMVTFVLPDGRRREIEAPVGRTILEIAQENGIDMEGTCEGAMACSTCHVIVDEAWFGRLPAPSEEEEDMLDLAPGLTRTSRLGCQIVVTEDLDGLVLSVPEDTQDLSFL